MPRLALRTLCASLALACLAAGSPAVADEVHILPARGAPADSPLFTTFTSQTGIAVKLAPARGEAGADDFVADVVMAVDAAQLGRLAAAGTFAPYPDAALAGVVPDTLRHPDGLWFGVSGRARVLFHNADLTEQPPTSYEDVADARFEGLLCMGPGRSPYNLSMVATMIERLGPDAAQAWVEGVVRNLAEAPAGGDGQQLRNVAAGTCAVTIANHYYHVRMQHSAQAEDREAAERITLVWPDQDGAGVLLNVVGAGIGARAPHPDNARRFLDYLASPEAQGHLAGETFYPLADPGMMAEAVAGLGEPVWSATPLARLADHLEAALAMIDAAGWPAAPPRN